MMPVHPNLDLFEHSALLVESFRRFTGHELLINVPPSSQLTEALFLAPKVVVSHGTEADPILNYGNRLALELWEMEWDEFTRTPSRLTAEPMDREERERLLARVTRFGFIDDYAGIRISKNGKRFRIENAVVWNLVDAVGNYRGQAAAFENWKYL